MKRIIVLLLALTMLLTLAAPALALETVATGRYPLEVNVEVPAEGAKIGGFTVVIPDTFDIPFGVAETSMSCSVEIDPERIAYGQGIGLDIAAENEDYFFESNGDEGVWTSLKLINENNDCIFYELYSDDEGKIDAAPEGWEEREDRLMEGYRRFVCAARNLADEPHNSESNVNVKVSYPDNVLPGSYHSYLTFIVSSNWVFNFDEVEVKGYRYIMNGDFENRKQESDDDEKAAFDPWGWPIDGRVLGIEPIDG